MVFGEDRLPEGFEKSAGEAREAIKPDQKAMSMETICDSERSRTEGRTDLPEVGSKGGSRDLRRLEDELQYRVF